LVFGSGRLISAAPAQAGKQIAVCVASRGRRFDVSCKWADVVDLVGSNATAELRWAKDAIQTVEDIVVGGVVPSI